MISFSDFNSTTQPLFSVSPASPFSSPLQNTGLAAQSDAPSFANVLAQNQAGDVPTQQQDASADSDSALRDTKPSLQNSRSGQKPLSGKDAHDKTDAKDKKTSALGGTDLLALHRLHSLEEARSFKLSLPKSEKTAAPASRIGDKTGRSAATEDPADETVVKSDADNSKAALKQQPVAFGATLSKFQSASQASNASGSIGSAQAPSISQAQAAQSGSGDASGDSSGAPHEDKGTEDSSKKPSADGIASGAVTPATTITAPTIPPPIVAPVPAPASLAYMSSTSDAAPLRKTSEIEEPPDAPAVKSSSIEFQVPTGSNEAVNVRVAQRAGDVEITVRTGDDQLAQSLRQHLPELSDKLTGSGVHADLWQPSSSGANNHNDSSQSDHTDERQYPSGSRENSQNPQQQQQQNRRSPAWRDAFGSAEN